MLTLLGITGSAHGGVAAAGIVAALLMGLSMLAVGIVLPTQYKNSGILRYRLSIGQAPTVIQVLGAGADVLTADADNQLFGGSPGHDAVLAAAPFGALQQQPTQVLVANPVRPGFDLTHTAPTAYIPSGTKVHAYFIVTDPASTATIIAVQTQVTESRIRRGSNGTGNNVADASGAFYLGAIVVAVQTVGATAAFGTLVVELQHSEHDIPGAQGQDQTIPPN